MDGNETSGTIDLSSRLRGKAMDPSAMPCLAPGRDHTVWSIDLRCGSPVEQIAIEQVEGVIAFRVLVDGIEVGRSDRVEVMLRYVHRFDEDLDRAARTRDRVLNKLLVS
jgi:hypothetical protein